MKIDWESFWLVIVGHLIAFGGIALDAIIKYDQGGIIFCGIMSGAFIIFLGLKIHEDNSYGKLPD